MKEDTQSCLWQDFTHSNQNKNLLKRRLHIFTGKGGTGKTSLSLAWTKYLLLKKKKVIFNNLGQNLNKTLKKSLNIAFKNIDSKTCMQDYMAKKLNSEIISKWIMDTSFFNSLFSVVPSLGYVTYLGYIIKMLEHDKKLHIVIDAESSGHAITMLESPFNFKDIFLSGLLVEDLDMITNYLKEPEETGIFTICNPTPMSVTENKELIKKLKSLQINGITPILNNSYSKLELKNTPNFLKKKILLENKSIKDISNYCPMVLSHHAEIDEVKIIKALSKEIGEVFS